VSLGLDWSKAHKRDLIIKRGAEVIQSINDVKPLRVSKSRDDRKKSKHKAPSKSEVFTIEKRREAQGSNVKIMTALRIRISQLEEAITRRQKDGNDDNQTAIFAQQLLEARSDIKRLKLKDFVAKRCSLRANN
jgi:hypothetical protein